MLIANDVDEVLLQGCLVKVIMILKMVKMVTTMITTAMTMMRRRRKNPPQEEASDDDDKLHLQVVCILFHPNKQTLQNRDHSLRAATNLHDDDDDDVDDVDDDDDDDDDDIRRWRQGSALLPTLSALLGQKKEFGRLLMMMTCITV